MISELTTWSWLLSHFGGSHFSSLAKRGETSFGSEWHTASSACDDSLPSASPTAALVTRSFDLCLPWSCGPSLPHLTDETHLALGT